MHPEQVAVIGAGVIGCGVAQCLAEAQKQIRQGLRQRLMSGGTKSLDVSACQPGSTTPRTISAGPRFPPEEFGLGVSPGLSATAGCVWRTK